MSGKRQSKGLGRGLKALLSESAGGPAAPDEKLEQDKYNRQLEIHIDKIKPNPRQPRADFNEDGIEELAKTIIEHGLISPLVVRKVGEFFELVAGERRLRAARIAGIKLVPAIVRDVEDHQMLELALIENVQRSDLNPIELARAYKHMCDSLSLTASEVAVKVGKKRESVANYVRLLQLEPEIQDMVAAGKIAFGHARALLAIQDPERRKQVADLVGKDRLSVRQVEKFSSKKGQVKGVAFFAEIRQKPAYLKDLEQKFQEKLGTKVLIKEHKGKGKITIEFYSNQDFERIMGVIGVTGADF